MHNESNVVIERRLKTELYLTQGLKAHEISKKLSVSVAQTYDDMRQIKKDGHKFMRRLIKTQGLNYWYYSLINNCINTNKLMWEIANNQDTSDSDKIKAAKTIVETINVMRDIGKDYINMTDIAAMKNDIEQLKNNTIEGDNHKGYMNIQLPQVIDGSKYKIPVTNLRDQDLNPDNLK